jgi:diguanylate cyclase (GGDEF)-like protein
VTSSAQGGSAKATRLRSRWNRRLAFLTTLILLGGMTSLIGTRLLVGEFRQSAVRVEREATTGAKLRADVISHAIAITSPITDAQQQRRTERLASAIRAGFVKAVADAGSGRATGLFEASLAEWQAIVDAAGPPDHRTDRATFGAVVSVRAPKVLALLDQAGSISRAEVRMDLAEAARVERQALAVLSALLLLAVGLALRLARLLTTEVLRPVRILSDSANHLAAGELDHRVVIDRADELGDLAVSFNTMADAIAGSQRTLSREANFDSLTELANRAAFNTRLEATLARPERRRGSQAVLFVDLDDFKDVNDTMGHAAGDDLLRAVAERLSDAVRPGDVVARLGGDEFALLLDDLLEPGDALTVAERVLAAVAEPVEISGSSAHVGASIGLAMRQVGSTIDALMREADVAMYAAKAKGKNRVVRYDSALDDMTVERQSLMGDLTGATERGELVLDYQPVVDLDTGMLVGLEALVRWQHPSLGLLPPLAFIGLAEETGAIIPIGAWVLHTAAHQLQNWQRRYGLPDLWMSVNVSVSQLNGPHFATEVEHVLTTTGLDPARLLIEVTESVLADHKGGAATTLAALRLPGVRVALDDFGVGYSSIAYLRQLPLDVLKIDRSFVSGAEAGDPGNDTLLEAIVAMGQRLGLDVIPEGIEELDQISRLRAMGCRVGQGFLLSRPLSPEAVEALLASPLPVHVIGLHSAARAITAVTDSAVPALPIP